MHRISKLALKFIAGFVLLGVLICGTSSFIGYQQYRVSIETQYNDRAYRCAEVALSYVDMDTLREYVELVKGYRDQTVTDAQIEAARSTETYHQIDEQIKKLRAAMGANDVFLFALDQEELLRYDGTREGWTPLLYIFDSYTDPALSYTLGDRGSFNPDYIQELNAIGETGERSDSYFFSEGDYGSNTAALLPLVDNGEVLAIAAVEIPMVTLQTLLRQYVLYAILTTVVLIILFIAVYMIYLYRRVIQPVNLITEKARVFAHNNRQITGELAEVKTRDEIQSLASTVLQMEIDINDYIDNLTRVTAEKERIGAELDVAARIQADMLPCIFPAFPDRHEFDIHATMTPAKEVGGDFYDFFLVDDDHLALVMADVSGKGVPAALFMMISKTLIKSAAQTGLSPKEVLEAVNNQLCENNEAEMFVTVWLGILELSSGHMRCANAGHEYPAIRRQDGPFELLKDKHGFVLGGMENVRYKEYDLTLSPGDSIFVYTDGVAEATNAQNELFGTDRMLDALNRKAYPNCAALLCGVHNEINAFVGEAPQFDDITMLCLTLVPQDTLLLVPNEESMPAAAAFVEQRLRAAEVPPKVLAKMNIAVDEIYSNIIRYSGATRAEITCRVEGGEVLLSFSDNGAPYNPLEKPDPDTSLDAEDRQIGGLGIFMVKKSMDAVTYRYEDGKNILTLQKNC